MTPRPPRDVAGKQVWVAIQLNVVSLEIEPDREAPDKIGRGVIKRVRVPNSWAGDYGKCAKLLSAAQEFFTESLATPAPKAETRRFGV